MRPIRVLLVDDEVEFMTALSKVLKRRGFEVDVALDGESALAAAIKGNYDVAVLDVKMPGMDGIQVLSEMKKISPMTEVILMTGHLSLAEEKDGLNTGAFAYLLKPLRLSELISHIEKAAARGKSPSA